jgi:hypothetical protein
MLTITTIAENLERAFKTTDARLFMDLIFPAKWRSISARIIETGVTLSSSNNQFAPRWTPVPPTIRHGKTDLETQVKSCIYRAHDLIHQLWGLPIPGSDFTEEDFYIYKRAQMCGEVVVLMFTEFILCKHLAALHPHIGAMILKRNALPMLHGPLQGRTPAQIAARLDNVLHQHKTPKWLREDASSVAFANDYVPMLERDRAMVDHNWALMKKLNWLPTGAPNSRYSPMLDGMELTLWMVNDFFHLMDTDATVDEGLVAFNQERRSNIKLPADWNNV